tara:strand:- start:176 stop:649 length:474 start_codon:yes stop_codon:yes gene_type:complete
MILFSLFGQVNVIRANPVKGISDFDGSFKGVERIDFECPANKVKKIRKPNEDLEDHNFSKSCWVDFYPTYLNVMDKQVINRNDVISFFVSPPSSGKCCASWNLIYRDKEGNTKILTMRRNVLPFPLTKRKLKRLGTPSNIVYRWLVNNHEFSPNINP